jgi:hypothetical protein
MARTVAGAGGGSGVRERLAGPVQIAEKMVLGGEMTSFCSDSILASKKATQ